MLSGEVADAATLDKAVIIARQFGPDIINTVSVMSPQQVMLEVRFVELSRTAGRELGVQWNVFNRYATANIGSQQPASNLPLTAPASSSSLAAGEAAAGVLSGASPFGFAIGRILSGSTTIDVALNALEQKGLARSLAEPNLVALSGDTASFLAGGEYPIPVSGSFGQVTVDYKKYGVGLAFTPTVLGRGLINLKIEPEVSQIDTTHTVSVSTGVSVPALIVRRASTTIELRDGQSFMIGGLLQTNNQNQIDQLPWLGTVPVLGALFSVEVLSAEPDRPRHHRDAASGAADAAGRCRAHAGRRHGAAQRSRLLPARQGRAHAQAGAGAHARHGPLRRGGKPSVHRAHARSAEGGIRCGHPVIIPRALALAALLTALAGCSEYLDRRDTISLDGGNSVATNEVSQMVDPWPRDSANRNIAFNGDKMETAVERYRTNRVIPPQGIGTSASYQQGSTNQNNQSPVGPTVTQSAASVK